MKYGKEIDKEGVIESAIAAGFHFDNRDCNLYVDKHGAEWLPLDKLEKLVEYYIKNYGVGNQQGAETVSKADRT